MLQIEIPRWTDALRASQAFRLASQPPLLATRANVTTFIIGQGHFGACSRNCASNLVGTQELMTLIVAGQALNYRLKRWKYEHLFRDKKRAKKCYINARF